MDNLEFQTLLGHLGRDVSSMGFKIKKEADQCIADLDRTQDTQVFCRNLVDILSSFSIYTVQYAKKLEERIKAAGKEEEYSDAVNALLQLTCKGSIIRCNNCTKSNNSASLDPCVGSSGDKSRNNTELSLDIALSQCSSVHLGDELKLENETQPEPEVSNSEEIITVESPSGSSSNGSSSTVFYDLPCEANGKKASSCLDDNIADVLEVSHSEELDTGESHDVANNPVSTTVSSLGDEIFDKETVANSPPNLQDVDQVADSPILHVADEDDVAPAPVSVPSSSGEKGNDISAVSTSVDNKSDDDGDSDVDIVMDSPKDKLLLPQPIVKTEDVATSRGSPDTVAAASRFDESDSDAEIVADSSEGHGSGDSKPAAIKGKYSSIDESDDSDIEFVTSTSSPNLATSPHVENIAARSQQISEQTDVETEPNSSLNDAATSHLLDTDNVSLGGDSDATVADLTPQENAGSDSDDQAALPGQEQKDDDTDLSQVFSLRGSIERTSDVDLNDQNPDSVAHDSDSDMNLDVPTQAIETATREESQGSKEAPGDVGTHSDSDADFDCPTQEAKVIQEQEIGSSGTERNMVDSVVSEADTDVDFGAATQVSSGQNKSPRSDAPMTTEARESASSTPQHNWNSQVDYEQPTQMILSRPDKSDGVANSGVSNYPSGDGPNNGGLIGSTGPEAEDAAPEIEQLQDVAMDNDGDISESDSEPSSCTGSVQSLSKKKLKTKERLSLIKVISDFFAKRKMEKQGNGQSSGAKKVSKKSTRNRKLSAKSQERRHKTDEASPTPKKGKKKGTPVKKSRTKLSRSHIDESSDSSSEFTRDNTQINQDSSGTSDNDDAPTQLVDRSKKTDTLGDKNACPAPATNACATIERPNSEKLSAMDNAGENPNDDDDLEVTQRADIRTLRWLSDETSNHPISGKATRDQAQPSDHSAAANSDQSVEDSEVVFKRKSVPPLPSSHSDSQPESSASPDSEETPVVRSFKKKTVLPLPSTQSDADGVQTGEESEDTVKVVNPFKRKAVLPLRSSQSEEADTPSGPEDVQEERAAKRLHSSGESDSEPPRKISGSRSDVSDVAGLSAERRETDSGDSADAEPHPKRRKIDATESEVSSDAQADRFNLDDTGRDDLLEMLNLHVKDDESPTGESGSDREVEAPPASQFNLDDGGRDNLLNLLTDKERDQHAAEFEPQNDAEDSQMGNAERDEFLELLNGTGNDDDTDDLEITGHTNDIVRSKDDESLNKPDLKDTKTAKTLDDDERNELLNLLIRHLQDRQTDGSDTDELNLDNDKANRRKKVREVDREELMALVKEYEEAISKEKESDTNSVVLDILREEPIVERSHTKKRKPGRPKDHSKEAWEAYESLLRDDDDISDSSSAGSDVDLDDLESDFSDLERRTATEARNAELRRRFGIRKELMIDLVEMDISRSDDGNLRSRQKAPKDDDRLCNLSNILHKRTTAKRRRKHKSNSSSSLGSLSDPSPSSGSDHDESSLLANHDSGSDHDSTPQALSDDEERERMANALWDNIRNSSDDQSGWGSSSLDEGDSSDERGKKTKKRRKKASVGKSGGGKKTDSSDGSDGSGSEDDDGSGGSEDKEGKSRDSKGADLDSSDEDDFVGVRKGRGAWRRDPLLKSCLSSDSDSSDSPRKRPQKRKETRAGNASLIDSDSDATTIDTEESKSPAKNVFKSDKSDDSDFEIIEKQKTPQKIITLTDDEDTPSKRGKGRRNIRALVEDNDLAEATQRANNEEKERIRRLQERDKAKESFTQSQSLGSQQSEEDADPLILDVHGDVQIKVHPKILRKLKPHQRDGIQFMWDSCYESVKQIEQGWRGSGCILAHCMGLGKTLQALALIQTLFSHPVTKTMHVLVVCPLSTVSNWKNEYYLAYKGIKPSQVRLYTIENVKVAAHRFDIVSKWWLTGGMLVLSYECFGLLVNDEKLKKMEDQGVCRKEEVLTALVNPGPDLVICDEGHLLRNKQTQRTLALNRVNTKRRIVLTGTPLQNNLLEYYYMVHFVKPNLLGTEKEFKTNFINPINNGQFEDSTAGDIMIMKKRTHVLHKILNKTVQRVEDTELKQYLPKLVDQAVFIKLSDLQVNLYNKYLDTLDARPVIYTKSGNVRHQHFLADVQILRYICAHPDVVTTAEKTSKSKIKEQDVIEDNMEDVVEDKVFSKGGWYKTLLTSEGTKKLELGSKMMVAISIVKEATANGDKVLIFAQSYAEMDNLESFLSQHFQYKKGRDYYRMDGTISPEVRTHMCDKFNRKDNNNLKVFIMSTKVGGLGLNLTAANRVIIMNVNWNPSYDTQSVFRAFRFGQTKAVYVYRLIAIDTMEEKMYQRVVTKLAVAHRVVDKHQITRHYSAGDMQEFYSARPTVGGDRPVPNVPEDRILAKLVQKHQFLWRWHEHQALLANRPEEDLDEQQKNAAWEEFNKQPADPPIPAGVNPHLITASALLAQQGPSGMQNKINAFLNSAGRAHNLAGNAYPDHNYSLPKNNALLHHRTSSSDDFRIPAQPVKYVPRPIFAEAPPPGGAVNPVAALKAKHALAKTAHSRANNPQMHLGNGVTISRDMAPKTQKTQPPQHQKPSITITPQNVRPAPRVVPANGSLVENPVNLSKKGLHQNPVNLAMKANLSKPTAATNAIAQNTPGASQKSADKDAQALLNEQLRKHVGFIVNKTGSRHKVVQNLQSIRGNNLQKRRIPVNNSASSQNYIDLRKFRPKPKLKTAPHKLITVAPPLTNTAATVAATPTVDPSGSPTASTAHQSPLQMQMRTFMDHLHLLQKQMKGPDAVPGQATPPGGVATANGPHPVSTSQGPAAARDKGTFANASGSPTPRVVVKVGPALAPVVSAANVNKNLYAARNLSDFSKTKSPQNTNDTKASSTQANATPSPQAVRMIGSLPNREDVASRQDPATGLITSRMKINGVPVTKVVAPWKVPGKTGPTVVKRLIRKGLPLSSEVKKVIIADKNASAQHRTPGGAKQSPVRLVPAQLTNNPLQRKMVAKLDKLNATLLHPSFAPANTFKNGANLRTYQANRKDGQSPRTNSLSSLSSQPTPLSKSNKENFNKKRLSQRVLNTSKVTASIDLSKENDNGSGLQGSLSEEVVNTLKRKGVSINYIGKEVDSDVIRLD